VLRSYKEENWGNEVSSVREAVKKKGQLEESWGSAVQRGLEHGRRGIAIVRSRYQETSSEDTASWKKLSICCSDL
jgi:hypothetical protein